jgi:diadenosine tetraphosphate (Ap4A) HIT family hydrolase
MKNMECLFCEVEEERKTTSNEFAYSIRDGFPVTDLHTLIIPRRHVETYFDLSRDELLACDDLLRKLADRIKEEDPTVEGFNIGINAGAVAGQTIFHCHIHLIPRRNGDVDNPRGGVRHLIPGKGYY